MLLNVKAFLKSCFPNYQHSTKRLLKNINAQPETSAYITPRYNTLEETLPPAKYGGRYLVTMIPGDGIGLELMCHVKEIMNICCSPIDFEMINFDEPEDIEYIVNSTRRNQCAIKGHMERWYDKQLTFDSPNVALRKKLNLRSYITNFKTYKGIECKFPEVDVVLVRQNTEGEYSMLEHETVKGMVDSLKIVTRDMVSKSCMDAINYAKKHDRKKITVIHKANIMKLTDGLFRDVCLEMAQSHDIEMNDFIVDNACMQIVQNPYQFDIILCPNLYGNIITNIICGLIGGPGIVAAANYGTNCAVFEPACRSRAKNLEGKDVANPTSFLNAAILLMCHLGFSSRAQVLSEALRQTIEDDGCKTKDVGGEVSTSDFIDTLKNNLCPLMEKEDLICPVFCEEHPIEINLDEMSTPEQWAAGSDKISNSSRSSSKSKC